MNRLSAFGSRPLEGCGSTVRRASGSARKPTRSYGRPQAGAAVAGRPERRAERRGSAARPAALLLGLVVRQLSGALRLPFAGVLLAARAREGLGRHRPLA